MKFKAKLSNDSVGSLLNVCLSLSKAGSMSAFYLSEDLVRIAIIPEGLNSPRCFSELSVDILFEEFRIESQSTNTILFELNIELLSKALASGRNSPLCIIKLVKRDSNPCICFEAQSVEGLSIEIVHDIPIKLLKSSDVVYYLPPELPNPTVCLELPRGKLLRTIVDKMCRSSKYVNLQACQSGKLVLCTDFGSASVRTYFNGLTAIYEGLLRPELHAANEAIVKLELKKLSLILSFTALNFHRAVVFVQEIAAVVLHIALSPAGSGSIALYLPVLVEEIDA